MNTLKYFVGEIDCGTYLYPQPVHEVTVNTQLFDSLADAELLATELTNQGEVPYEVWSFDTETKNIELIAPRK